MDDKEIVEVITDEIDSRIEFFENGYGSLTKDSRDNILLELNQIKAWIENEFNY